MQQLTDGFAVRELMVRFLWEKQAASLSLEYERTDRNIKLKENPTGFCCLLPHFELELDEQIWNSIDASCLTGKDRRLGIWRRDGIPSIGGLWTSLIPKPKAVINIEEYCIVHNAPHTSNRNQIQQLKKRAFPSELSPPQITDPKFNLNLKSSHKGVTQTLLITLPSFPSLFCQLAFSH